MFTFVHASIKDETIRESDKSQKEGEKFLNSDLSWIVRGDLHCVPVVFPLGGSESFNRIEKLERQLGFLNPFTGLHIVEVLLFI